MRAPRTQSWLKVSAALILSMAASPVAGQQPTITQLPAVTQAVVPVQAVAPLAASPQYPSPIPAEYPSTRADVAIDPAVRLASLPPGPERRMAELEQRFADFEARMAAQTLTSSAQQPTAAPPVAPSAGSVVGADTDMPAKWNFGFEAQSKDKVFRAKFGGQLQFDYTDYNQATQLTTTPINAPPGDPAGGIGRQNESVNFRRLRLRSEGTMYENVGWVVQPDFANAANVSNVPGNPPGFPNSLNQAGFPAGQTLAIVPSLTDCYVTVMKLPVVNNLRIGNFKEPTGLEHMTSSRFLDFMERNYIQDMIHGPFNNGFSPGAMFFNWTEEQNSTWQLWGGPNQANLFGYHVGQGEWAGTMRGTYLPYYDEASNGRYMVHLGTSLSARKPDQGQDRFRVRGDLRDGPPSTLNTNYLDSGSFLTSFQYIISRRIPGDLGSVDGSGRVHGNISRGYRLQHPQQSDPRRRADHGQHPLGSAGALQRLSRGPGWRQRLFSEHLRGSAVLPHRRKPRLRSTDGHLRSHCADQQFLLDLVPRRRRLRLGSLASRCFAITTSI